mmetsp:Transcript_4133/g.9160  ORF Transcript_4133/g.9160 Transcript_4133/m.9160 type:complete len:136 (-) Transcript_4133:62-469(-)|eukprot:CAMPEP_0204276666 /NCGR_PEP_ID=MMETSP0468-20130131/28599_1 /ASSEMBLY_ACC=CAM_ASM_000383 /TAXON_ID=2969 /ORGANISM="Oxyrrhis marina" /LENGTH=135 /DNA_ID=CAMNT_0051253327 /DNA_START=17 /DNA_END=424 /DNA_ORIENTATION=-
MTEDREQQKKAFAYSLIAYGLFLAGAGTVGSYLHNFEYTAMHSMYSGCSTGSVMLICAAMASLDGKVSKLGIHLSIVGTLALIVVMGVQAYKSFGNPDKFDRFVLFVIMFLGSVVNMARSIVLKPKSEKSVKKKA